MPDHGHRTTRRHRHYKRFWHPVYAFHYWRIVWKYRNG